MPESDDHQLLREFAQTGSEAAFAVLVERYVNLVYSAAVRSTGNPHDAEEITQAVFIILARKAGNLSPRTVMSGWLYQTTRLTAANFKKGEGRRQRREQEAYMQSTLEQPQSAHWEELAPLLEEAMGHLDEADRTAIVLHYFEKKTAAQTAAALCITEAAVYKRTHRALEKLKNYFAKRGVTSTAASLAEAITANSIQFAPVALAKSVTVLAAAKGAVASSSTLILIKTTMKTLTWIKIKPAIIIAAFTAVAISILTIVIAQAQTPAPIPAGNPTADDSMLITPGTSVGKVTKGMNEDQVIAAIGQPDRKQGEILVYDSRFGFSVVCSRKKIVGAVFCGGGVDFKGRTKEGIGVGSSRDNIIKAFGQPDSAKPWAPGQEQLVYNKLGLTFILQDGNVFQLIVSLR